MFGMKPMPSFWLPLPGGGPFEERSSSLSFSQFSTWNSKKASFFFEEENRTTAPLCFHVASWENSFFETVDALKTQNFARARKVWQC